MPIYSYRCAEGHSTDTIRSYDRREECPACRTCGLPTERLFPIPHVEPDGIYSYAPNVGSEEVFERRRTAIREGQKLIKKDVPDNRR